MEDLLDIAKRNLSILESTSSSEQDVKRLVVEPVMMWAGIEIYDPNTLREEYRINQVNHTTHADYAIFKDGNVRIAVEAKKIGEELENNLKQLIDYCNYGSIRFGVITNGGKWWFVDEIWREKADRVFLKIELDSENAKFLKLINPKYMDVLMELADGIEETEGLKHQQKYRETLLNDALKKINEISIENSKKSQSNLKISEQNVERQKDEFITLSEFLDFAFKKENWKNISGLTHPPKVILNGQETKISSWTQLFVNFIKSSYKKIEIPFKISKRCERYIINTQNIHSTGKKMTSPHEFSDGQMNFYIETNNSIRDVLKIFKRIKEVGDLRDDYIKFPAEWFEYAKSYAEKKKV